MKTIRTLIVAASVLVAMAFVAVSCGNSKRETPTRGSITVLVDENLRPLIDAQAMVFQAKYPNAHVAVQAEPEMLIPEMMRADTMRVAVMARTLNSAEMAWFDSIRITPRITPIAYDAVALVVSRQAADTLISISDLKDLLAGRSVKGAPQRTLVFDNPASGIVRYMKEISGLDSLPGAYSFRSTVDMLSYVAGHPEAIGFASLDWINEADSTQQGYLVKLRSLAVGEPQTGFFRPSQRTIGTEQYPFIRKVYIINGQGTAGLGLGFAAFIAGDIGQRIVLRAGLLPFNFPNREIVIRTQL